MPLMKISEIKVVKKYSPRVQLDKDTISRYKELYELGVDLGPLTIQKKDKILIDGFHRIMALKRLSIKEVEVVIVDIPESEIYAESIRINNPNPQPFNKEDRNRQIWRLRHDEERTYREISKIVQLSETRVTEIYKDMEILRILGGEETKKIDKRKKIDAIEVVARLQRKERPIDIARDLGVSPARVSQISKDFKADEISPVVIVCEPKYFDFFIRTSLANGMISGVIVDFTEGGVLVTQMELGPEIAVALFFDKFYFQHYDAKGHYVMDLQRDMIDWLGLLKMHKYEEYIQFAFDGDKMAYSAPRWFGKYQESGLDVGTRPVPDFFELVDERGIPKKLETLFSARANEFRGMPDTKEITISFENDVFTLNGITNRGWKIFKEIPSKAERPGNVSATVNGEVFKKLLSLDVIEWNVGIQARENKLLLLNWNRERCWGSYMLGAHTT